MVGFEEMCITSLSFSFLTSKVKAVVRTELANVWLVSFTGPQASERHPAMVGIGRK